MFRNSYRLVQTPNIGLASVASTEKREIIRNLYLSGIGAEFIAMQLDLEIPTVIAVLKDLEIYLPD